MLIKKHKQKKILREVTEKERRLITSIVGTDGGEAEKRRRRKLNEMVIGIKDERLE